VKLVYIKLEPGRLLPMQNEVLHLVAINTNFVFTLLALGSKVVERLTS